MAGECLIDARSRRPDDEHILRADAAGVSYGQLAKILGRSKASIAGRLPEHSRGNEPVVRTEAL